jgi:aspartyl-tRNA(Asn)/glutamyl-tRNA(Gln) amidotransferase subunit A
MAAMSSLVRRRDVLLSVGAGAMLQALPRSWGASIKRHESDVDQLTALSLSEAAVRLRSGQTTAEALTRASLERAAAINPKLNAFITLMGEHALAQARALDLEAAAGKFRSTLHGIPISLKDNIDTAGIRTTAASAVFDDRVPTDDAQVVTRLVTSGAVIIGKTNMHEFALGGSSTVSYFGAVKNPWNLAYSAGGSSGGSAAALAANLCFGSIGTDTGGSIRIPGAWCGVVGLKPTYGLVPLRGIIPVDPSIDHCGPMARTVEDVATLLTAVAGYDRNDPTSVNHPVEDYGAHLGLPVSEFKLGIPREPFFDSLDEDTARAFDEATRVLKGLTRSLQDVHLPSVAAIDDTAIDFERQSYHRELLRKRAGLYMPSSRATLQQADEAINDDRTGLCSDKTANYIQSRWNMELLRRTIDDVFVDVDFVVLPTMRVVARSLDKALEAQTTAPTSPDLIYNTVPFNIYGIPAISIPCGRSREGLPIGLMIAGPHFSEVKLLALAQAYERATPWHQDRPNLLGASGR